MKIGFALLALVAATAANAQEAPGKSDFRIVGRSDEPFLRAWRATIDYRQNAGPIEDAVSRVGFNRGHEVKFGLEFAIGANGFGRLEIGRGWRDSKRSLPFEDLRGEADDVGFGGTAGWFVLPFAAVGLSFQYRTGDGEDIFINRSERLDDDLRPPRPELAHRALHPADGAGRPGRAVGGRGLCRSAQRDGLRQRAGRQRQRPCARDLR